MDKHTKILYGLIIVGFLSLSAQLWLQTKAINDLNIKMESVRELLYRFAWLFWLKKHPNFCPDSVEIILLFESFGILFMRNWY
jgi:hypothetical protein